MLTDKREYCRRITILERAHLRQPNANVVMVVRFKGKIKPEDILQAMKKIREIHPLIGSRVLLTSNQEEAYFVTQDVPEQSIKVAKREDEKTWEKVVIDELKIPFYCEKGPLIRFVLCSSEKLSELIITCHHIICDGLAIIYFIRDLFLELTNQLEQDKMKDPPLISEDNLPKKIKPNFLSKLVFKRVNKNWKKKKIKISEVDFRKLHEKFWQMHEPQIITWSFDQKITNKIIHCSKENNVSVNTILVTALLAAQQKATQVSKFDREAIISVSFRQRLLKDAGESFGKFASAIRPEISYEQSLSFWSNTKKLHQIITKNLNDKEIFNSLQLKYFNPVFVDAFAFNKYGFLEDKILSKIIERSGLGRISVGTTITNLGKLTIPTEFEQYSIDSIFGPFVFSDTMEKYLGILTINNKLQFSFSFGNPYINISQINELKEKFNEIITNEILN